MIFDYSLPGGVVKMHASGTFWAPQRHERRNFVDTQTKELDLSHLQSAQRSEQSSSNTLPGHLGDMRGTSLHISGAPNL